MSTIAGNMIGTYSPIGKTFIIEDSSGNEFTGVVVDTPTVFTAENQDVRMGKVYAGEQGVSVGETEIPEYHTIEGTKLIPVGGVMRLTTPYYQYTKLQSIICVYDTNLTKSILSEKVVINDSVYPVSSNIAVSSVTKDDDGCINFNITNTSDTPCVIRYIFYKEIN